MARDPKKKAVLARIRGLMPPIDRMIYARSAPESLRAYLDDLADDAEDYQAWDMHDQITFDEYDEDGSPTSVGDARVITIILQGKRK